MKRWIPVTLAFLVPVTVAVLVVARGDGGRTEQGPPAKVGARDSAASLARGSRAVRFTEGAVAATGPRDPAEPDADAPEEQGRPPEQADPFRVDGTGRLVIDPETRHEVEKLVLLHGAEELETRLREMERSLPAAAAASVRQLVGQFRSYIDETKQRMPPGRSPRDEGEGLAALEMVHAIRVRHFGAPTAHAMFGLEERLARGLLQVSMLEKDPSLSQAERARRIRAIRDSLPEFQAIEFMNIATSIPDDDSE